MNKEYFTLLQMGRKKSKVHFISTQLLDDIFRFLLKKAGHRSRKRVSKAKKPVAPVSQSETIKNIIQPGVTPPKIVKAPYIPDAKLIEDLKISKLLLM